jgi:tetratricopeptide (TPR) repeat protein
MQQSSIAACAKAMELQLAGHLDLARQLYEAILQAAPQHAAANYGVGMLEVQSQRPEDGLPYLKAALQSQLDVPDYWLGYLEALKLAGRTEAARSILALGRQQGLAGPAVDDFSRRLESRLDAERRDQESALQSLFDKHDHARELWRSPGGLRSAFRRAVLPGNSWAHCCRTTTTHRPRQRCEPPPGCCPRMWKHKSI